ncbi:hypothetical protein TKK_0000315 [Trichogramma kaykai]
MLESAFYLHDCVGALHIELASSLNMASAILALRRFTGRQGSPAIIHSDIGTNLVSAYKEQLKAIKSVDNSKIVDYAAIHGIEWPFNPPTASNMGGV